MKRQPQPFDLYGPLPAKGVTLLEASAGTGKTFTIAGLVSRYVAEGVPLERLLVVTFTRMASGELRDQVRHRLVSTAAGLSEVVSGGGTGDPDDRLVRLLANGEPEQVRVRLRRLNAATADFDAATIDTTHGFCLHVLLGLGVAGNVERGVKLVEDTSDLLDEVVQDLYVRRFWSDPHEPPVRLEDAMSVAKAVVGNPAARIVPDLSDDARKPALRRSLADSVLTELDRRKRAAGILTYDDLLTRLRAALCDRVSGPAARARLANRYEVVLVDEFQDTDPVQWDIIDRAFRESTLVLIGDPKQAIYAFRGADVYAYLNAARTATTVATLTTNWRSDQGLIDAYDVLFDGAQLGHAGIEYRRVHAPEIRSSPGMVGGPCEAPLRVRIVDRAQVAKSPNGYAPAGDARQLIARDLAADVRAYLADEARIVDTKPDGSTVESPVGPGDVAVLVRANSHASTVREALLRAGVPAVVAGGGSVFGTEPAVDWERLLAAIDKPSSRSAVAAAALTRFIGWDAREVATAGDDRFDELHIRLSRWSAVLRERGVAALVEHVCSLGLPKRVLSQPYGERHLTDLLHVGRLLHQAATEENLGPSGLLAWLDRRMKESVSDRNDELSLRLESDAEAVQILTVHRSKGLEFPIVYCPFLWSGWSEQSTIPVFHDPFDHDALTVDVGGDSLGICEHRKLAQDEERGEELRLLYVALTRARHRAVIWWAGAKDSGKSPLGRLLFFKGTDGVVSSVGGSTPSDLKVREHLEELSAQSGGRISVETVEAAREGSWLRQREQATDLEAAVFDRGFDTRWTRTSYSGITAGAHDPVVGSEPDETVLTDEPPSGDHPATSKRSGASEIVNAREGRTGSVQLDLSDMPGGTSVGSFVHTVMELTDFCAPDLEGELDRALAEARALRNVDIGDPGRFVTGLRRAIETPLGQMVGNLRLRDIARRDRLDELAFELPVGGGDRPVSEISMSQVAAVLRAHLAPDDPLAGYALRLSDPRLANGFHGYLTGSIDLAFRFSAGRLAVVDYKTNRLAPAGQQISAWHYRREALDAEMFRDHYPLQAILYTVALHRYMRWRDPRYDPYTDLGGVLYLFLRGMSGPEPRTEAGQTEGGQTEGGEPPGVWSWRPPAALVVELSDLLDAGAAA